MSGCSRYANFLTAGVFFVLSVVTASCGDFQDPASGVSGQSALSETEFTNPSAEEVLGNPAQSRQNEQNTPITDLATFALLATESPGETRLVTLGWDPSSSEGVLGYKLYLIAVSTAVEQIIDVGSATTVALPLKIGETYGFTVTAYNSSMESQAVPYVLFHVFHNAIG